MKKRLLTVVMAFGFLASSISALAAPAPVTVDVPFGFTAGGKNFPAGRYRIQQYNDGGTFIIRHIKKSSKAGMFLAVVDKTGKYGGESKIVFRRYGDRYFLGRISLSETGVKYQLMPSSDERELRDDAKLTAQGAPEYEEVALAIN